MIIQLNIHNNDIKNNSNNSKNQAFQMWHKKMWNGKKLHIVWNMKKNPFQPVKTSENIFFGYLCCWAYEIMHHLAFDSTQKKMRPHSQLNATCINHNICEF